MANDLHATARRLRQVIEPVAAAVYFAPEAQQRYEALGLNYFEGYFCSRSAPLGKAPWQVVAGVFAAFKPAVVERAVSSGWSKSEPEALLEARLGGAREQMVRCLGEPGDDAVRVADVLLEMTDGADPSGRPLYAGLSSLPVPGPDDPAGRLWRAADLVREYRGDGHVAAWIAHLDSVEATVLTELWWGIDADSYLWTRGWDGDDAAAARARLVDRGLLDAEGLTDAGRELREEIERDTDRSARVLVDRLGDRADEVLGLLQPWSQAMVGKGAYPRSPAAMFG